jgi:hypothetical protein
MVHEKAKKPAERTGSRLSILTVIGWFWRINRLINFYPHFSLNILFLQA